MEMQEMEIIIDNEGRITMKVNGARGEACLAMTKNIEDATGIVEERTYTTGYYEQPVTEEGNISLQRRS